MSCKNILKTEIPKPLGEGNEPIAVVGMSCRFPSANNLSEFWDLLENGRNGIGLAPVHRWKPEQYPILPPGLEKVEAGFLNVPIDEFDAKFFEISPKEAAAMDPQHRLLLEVVWESFEDAALNPQKLRGTRGGVFLGSWLNQFREVLRVDEDEAGSGFYRDYKGTCVGVGAARISQLLGWTGPCTGTESDCSAGLTSVSMACKSLQNQDCSIALACGINLLVSPFTLDDLPAILSPDFRCKTFDESANGFARAEGAGALVLKRYSDAVRDGDRIWGLIRGTAVSQEGMNSSMGTPTVSNQMEAMTCALKDGGVDPAQVSYVEAHGTGTPVGDPVEMEAISKVYSKNRTNPITIGSVKTNLGHTESCSGITGLIKVLLSMSNETIPPHINFNRLNPKINLKEMNAKLPLQPVPWSRTPEQPRMAGVSSFGLAGKNCHVVLEEAPKIEKIKQKNSTILERPMHILKITAKSSSALDAQLVKYKNLFLQPKLCTFPDLAYSANIGRADFNYRAAIIADGYKSAQEILESGSFERNEINRKNKICFLFTGQGSQYQGMAKELYETSSVFQSNFDFCNEWLQSNYKISIKKAYFQDAEQSEMVNRTLYSQTGIFVVEYCLMRLWQSWGVHPQYVLGHSLGEFCAATCAGILNVEDALRLVAERSRLIDNLPPGKMLVVKGDKETVGKLQKEFFSELDYAAFNSEDQTVVAGCPEKILGFQEFIKNNGLKSTLLQSSHAFHSKDMDSILEEYEKTADQIQLKKPNEEITFISGMLGKIVNGSEVDTKYWVQHTRDAVNFIGACQTLNKIHVEDEKKLIYLEVGPNPVLSALVMANKNDGQSGLFLPSLRKHCNDWKTILDSLAKMYVAGVDIDWDGVDQDYSRNKVGHLLPKYSFQRTKFWPNVPSHLRKQPLLHPLLGSRLSNPTSTVVFQSQIPSSQQLKYLMDHKVGDRIVFPGAGYIEMMLAAGSAYFNEGDNQNLSLPSAPIQIKNLKILTPLELMEDFRERPTCQTILQERIEEGGQDGYKCSIFHQNLSEGGDTSNWVEHASATFHPLLEAENNEEELTKLLSYTNEDKNLTLISNFKLNVKEESLLKTFYENCSRIGLTFGESFCTLLKVWKRWETKEFLAEVTIRQEMKENHLLHPIITDAMLQTAIYPHFDEGFATGQKPVLVVPVACNRFVWLKPLKTGKCFVYSPNLDLQSALLFDEHGALVALAYKVEGVFTSGGKIKAVLDARVNPLPGFYEYNWEKSGTLAQQSMEKVTQFTPATQPKWIIFHGEEKGYLNKILNYFESIGRKNILVKGTSEISKVCCTEMETGSVEGIIVTCALSQYFQQDLAKPYLNLLQTLIKLKEKFALPPLTLLTKGQFPVEESFCFDPVPSTLIGMSLAAFNEHKELTLRIVDLDPADENLHPVFEEVFTHSSRDTPPITVFRKGNKYTPKFTTARMPNQSLSLNSTRFQLVLPSSKTIQDLKFGMLPAFNLKPNEIEVKIVCTALNFRDVLCVLKPSSYFATAHNIGMDFSGVVTRIGNSVEKWKLGDHVFGYHLINQPLISHVKIEEDQVDTFPRNFTFAEAASLPVVFTTAHYAIVELGNGKKDEVILIHAASGGVGLVAIQIAKQLGLKIICTAGSERKRAYLRSLGITHVFNSRSTEFSQQVLEASGGKGVDIVLNSLTGPGFKEATVKACAQGARFIEISKLNIFTVEEMANLRPDIKYSIIDPTDFEKKLMKMKYASVASDWMKNGKIQAIPCTRFDAGDIRQALTYLQQAKHIGKVVISMPETKNSNDMKKILLFNERSTYLITGGLGGIGLEVCKYMVEQGARYLVLVGRSPPTEEAKNSLQILKTEQKAQITVLQGDVGNLEDCERIFQHVSGNLPYPLRGIMHSAGALSDGMLENLGWEDFQKTFRSKVEGSWNLHNLTKGLNLEHFVLFSSVAAKLVPPGQATHTTACTFQDTLTHHRNSHGLPATSINWGQWGEVGVAKDIDFKIILPFSIQQGIQSLDLILRKNLNLLTVVNFRKNLGSALDTFPYMKTILDGQLLQHLSNSGNSSSFHSSSKRITSTAFWKEYSGDVKEKLQVSKKYLDQQLRNVFRMQPNDIIDEEADLSVLGMDSLMKIELVNLIQEMVGNKVKIPQGLIKECKTLKALATRLVEIIEEKWTETPAPSLEEVREQTLLDAPLPKEIQPERPGSQVAPSQIKTLLLTGATGFVGSHLLKELVERCPQLEKIYCLVRGKDPKKRVLSTLQKNGIALLSKLNLVEVISGDTSKANLGLNEKDYLQNGEEIDAIFHLGALVNHADYYRKYPKGSNDVRSVNVGGLFNILRFACKGKTKHVFFTSTLYTTTFETDEEGRLAESWPNVEKLPFLGASMGYPISKMICELHLKQAVEERGIPVKVFRCGTFRAGSRSSKSFAEGTHLMRLVLFFLKEGIVPNAPLVLNVFPVDLAVKTMAALSFNDEIPNEVFHLSHPRPLLVKEGMTQIAKEFNLPMSVVTFEGFVERLVERCKQVKKEFDKDGNVATLKKAVIYDLRRIYQDENLSKALQIYGQETLKGWKGCEEFWTSSKLQKFLPTIYSQIRSTVEILKKDAQVAIKEGFFN